MDCVNSSDSRSSAQAAGRSTGVNAMHYTLRDSLGRERRILLRQPPHYGLLNGDRLQPSTLPGKTGQGGQG